jgi:hypothetical protein
MDKIREFFTGYGSAANDSISQTMMCDYIAWKVKKTGQWGRWKNRGYNKTRETKQAPAKIIEESEQETYNSIFCWACETGQYFVVVSMVNLNVDIHCWEEYPFRTACKEGHLKIAKYIYRVAQEEEKQHNRTYAKTKVPTEAINLPGHNFACFRWACRNGHPETAKWVWNLIREYWLAIRHREGAFEIKKLIKNALTGAKKQTHNDGRGKRDEIKNFLRTIFFQ